MGRAENRAEALARYNPNAVGQQNGQLFGLPFATEDCDLVVLPVEWEATVSYGAGTAAAPANILAASPQLDLFLEDGNAEWKRGIGWWPALDIEKLAGKTRKRAEKIIRQLEEGKAAEPKAYEKVNADCAELLDAVTNACVVALDNHQIVGLLGGDHSTPYGLIRALAARHDEFGILQVDAHCDLRKAYEGFRYSHASVMYNVMEDLPQVSQLVQVGIRDWCEEEYEYTRLHPNRIQVFSDYQLRKAGMQGTPWASQTDEILQRLPRKVYISFDIDGLEPSQCPSTGTPVPGGLRWEEALYLIEALARSGRQIIGFDLVEVGSATEWDAVVGARLLYQLAARTLQTQVVTR